VEFVVAAVIGLAGLAYAVKQGRRARRPDLTDAEKAAIRRTRERTVVGHKISIVFMWVIAVLFLILGHPLLALGAVLVALFGWWSVVYLRGLLDE
jgi:hypothetical protein